MRYYIYISLVAVLTVFCFNNAMGQGVTVVGNNNVNGKTLIKSDFALSKLSNTDSGIVYIGADSIARILPLSYVKGGSGSIDTTGLSDRINYNLTRIDGLSDTALLHADTLGAHKDWLNSIEGQIAAIPTDTIPTWQAVLNEGRTGDSVLIDSNLYIGTTAERKPISIRVAGDSRDAVNEIPLTKIWTGRLANYLGATLDNRLSVSGSFLMNETPRYNPLNDTGALMDIITSPGKIRNVAGLTDSVYYFIVTRCINDLHWYTTYDSGYNYTPENYGIALRTVMDSLTAWGYQVIIMGPKYVLPTATHVIQDSVFRWIDTAKQVAADYNVPFFNAFTWQQSHGAGNLLSFVDLFHENTEGHEVLFTGMLKTMGYDVERNGQDLAVNGDAEFNSLTLRTSDTITTGAVPAFFNSSGKIVPGANELIRNNSTSSMPQGGNINLADTIMATNFRSRGLDGTSYRAANNTSAVRGSATTNGTIYFDPSEDNTGQIVFRSLPAQITVNSTGITTAYNIHGNILRATTAFQGNAASNGTLYVDASQNTTGTINFRAGSTATLNSSGLLVTALNVNNAFSLNSAGFITEYGNASITNGLIFIGNTALGRMVPTTLTAGSNITITNGAGSITIAATGFVDSVKKSNDSFFYYKGAVRTFIGLDNSGSGSGIDSVRISGDTLYQCSSGTCTFVGVVNSGGGGSGTVTSFTFTDGNGFDGTVTNSTTTPTLSIDLQADHNFVSDAELTNFTAAYNDKINSAAYSAGQLTLTQQDAGTVTATINDATTSVKGIASFNASDFDVSSGAVSTDYTNGQAASGSTKGFLTSADWTTFNNKQDALGFTAVPNTTTVNGLPLSSNITLTERFQAKIAGELDTLTTGVKLTFRMPANCIVDSVKGAVNVASSSGDVIFDLKKNGTTMMATNKILIEATETSSRTATQQPVLTTTTIADDDIMTLDVTSAGTNAISGEFVIYWRPN